MRGVAVKPDWLDVLIIAVFFVIVLEAMAALGLAIFILAKLAL